MLQSQSNQLTGLTSSTSTGNLNWSDASGLVTANPYLTGTSGSDAATVHALAYAANGASDVTGAATAPVVTDPNGLVVASQSGAVMSGKAVNSENELDDPDAVDNLDTKQANEMSNLHLSSIKSQPLVCFFFILNITLRQN